MSDGLKGQLEAYQLQQIANKRADTLAALLEGKTLKLTSDILFAASTLTEQDRYLIVLHAIAGATATET